MCLNHTSAINSLQQDIVNFYLAFRGNAHAARKLEQFKKTKKKPLQKSKSLRSKVHIS
jgi:uncharacterized membrane protein